MASKPELDACCFFWAFLLSCLLVISLYDIIQSGLIFYFQENYCDMYKYSGWCNYNIAQFIIIINLFALIFIIMIANCHVRLNKI